jgi:hypothetical protein
MIDSSLESLQPWNFQGMQKLGKLHEAERQP